MLPNTEVCQRLTQWNIMKNAQSGKDSPLLNFFVSYMSVEFPSSEVCYNLKNGN